MKATFKPVNPDELEMTLTVTQKMGDWRNLRTSINPSVGNFEFRNVLAELIEQAEKNFSKETKQE